MELTELEECVAKLIDHHADEDETIVLENFGFDENDEVEITKMIEEAINRMGHIPILRSKIARQRLYEDCGEKAFLDGAGLNYPVMNPKTCDYDCNLLSKAYYELSQSGRPGALDMRHKAKRLMEDRGCSHRVLVRVNEDVVISLDHLMFILS